MFKRSPKPIELKLTYDEFCGGCKKCRSKEIIQSKTSKKPEEKRSWIQMLIGSNRKTETNNKIKRIDYSNIHNDKCGTKHDLSISTPDLRILCQQAEVFLFSQFKIYFSISFLKNLN